MPAPGDSASKIKSDRSKIYARSDLTDDEKAQEYAIYSDALRRKRRKGKTANVGTEGQDNLAHLTVVPLLHTGDSKRDSADRSLRAARAAAVALRLHVWGARAASSD